MELVIVDSRSLGGGGRTFEQELGHLEITRLLRGIPRAGSRRSRRRGSPVIRKTVNVDAFAVREHFERYIAERGVRLEQLAAETAIRSMVDFYLEERVKQAVIDEDGDMLLFQWGTHDWGEGPSFEYGITRQLIVQDEEGDDSIWQLSLTLRYPSSDEARASGSGDEWCASPDDVDQFLAFIEDAPSTRFVRRTDPSRVQLDFEPTD